MRGAQQGGSSGNNEAGGTKPKVAEGLGRGGNRKRWQVGCKDQAAEARLCTAIV